MADSHLPAVSPPRRHWRWRTWLTEPSLARRTCLAVLLGFALVLPALLLFQLLQFKADVSRRVALGAATQAVAESLARADPSAVVQIAKASAFQFNRVRGSSELGSEVGELLFRVERLDGALVWASDARLDTAPRPVAQDQPLWLGDHAHWPVTREAGPWRVTMMDPAIGNMVVLRLIVSDLIGPLLLAFPFMLLPLWWAVRQGLKPVRVLMDEVSRRDPADLSPLALDLRYAELRPIVVAIDTLLANARAGLAREAGFVQDAAHELRTPMSVIAAQAHALCSAPDSAAQAGARTALERAVTRASHLVHQLLTLARLEGRALGEQPQAVDLVALARQIAIDLSPLAERNGIEMSLVSPETLPAEVPIETVHSVLENLLRNALQYCPRGASVELSIAHDGDGTVCLAVRDDGPGIAPDEAERLRQRFHRGRHAQSPGSGLGLAIVGEAARRLGGTLVLGTGSGDRGLGASLRFPVAAVPSPPPRQTGPG